MADPRTPVRPTRRAVLLSGALLAPLGLAGCDGDEPGPGKEAAPSPARVTATTVDITSAAQPASPLGLGLIPVSRASEHSLAALVRLGTEEGTVLRIATPARVGTHTVPIDPATHSLAVDDSTDAVRVFATRRGDDGYVTTLHTSPDLSTWTETPLVGEIDADVTVAQDSLAVASQQWQQLAVWDVAADGTLTELTPIPAESTQLLLPQGVARSEDRIVLLVLITDLVEDRDPELPATISSTDGGATWSAPRLLPGPPEHRSISALRFHGEDFVVLGGRLVQPDWAESADYWRPTCWTSADGRDFAEQDIPLPLWGLDGWTWGEKGDVDADTRMDMADLSWEAPVIDPEDGVLHLPVHYRTDLRIASRSPQGTWQISERRQELDDVIQEAVADPTGAVIAHPLSVTGITSVEERDGWRGAGMFTTAPSRGISIDAGPVGSPVSLLVRQATDVFRPEEDGTGEITVRRSARAFVIDGGVIDEVEDVPGHATVWRGLVLRTFGDGQVLLLGFEDDEEGEERLRAQVHDGTEWLEPEGLDIARAGGIEELVELDGTLHLCLRRWIEAVEKYEPVVLVSEDGTAWSELGAFDHSAMTGAAMGLGARILRVGRVGETLAGVGSIIGEDGFYRAAAFVLEGETWRIVPVPGARPGSTITDLDQVGGAAQVQIWTAGMTNFGELAADGTVGEVGAPTYHTRGPVLDLGDGVLLAGGTRTRALAGDGETPGGTGACVWASRDAGQTWDATPLPPGSGHGLAPFLLRDGADVLAVWMEDGTLHAFRLTDPVRQILGDEEPAA